MQIFAIKNVIRFALAAGLLVLQLPSAHAQANSYRGLWTGQVKLNRVNEVSVPLDENNVAIAPKPEVATPTADTAHLLLILHVNGAGQVSLLKDVAILNRAAEPGSGGGDGTEIVNLLQNASAFNPGGGIPRSESDLALVTDERIYPDFPVQSANRIASAVFDFGDSRATDALDTVMEAAAVEAAASVNSLGSNANLRDDAERQAAETAAHDAALPGSQAIVDQADVKDSFNQFLLDHFKPSDVDAIAAALDPAAEAATARAAAVNLQTNSFYSDSRAVEMIDAVVAAVEAAGTNGPLREKTAHNTTASFADASDNYQSFIAGKLFGDMITAAAEEAAMAAVADGATAGSIAAAVDTNGVVNDARFEALSLSVAPYADTRSSDAIEQVLNAIVDSAAASLPPIPGSQDLIQSTATQAGRDARANSVTRYPVSSQAPTLDYTEFVTSETFAGSAEVAASAAARGAVSERANNALYTGQSLEDAARVAAVLALRDAYSAAARAVRTELPLSGMFGPGQGDPRLTWEIEQQGLDPLAQTGALEGTIYLPANHPTNPFRHRRHPDHTAGFDIRRNIRLDFDDSDGSASASAGFGVERVTGTYREEIAGLHKPLGPDKNIGLKVEGTFELNRISLIDTLNAR